MPGQLYELQIFMLDDRSGINKTFPLQFQMIHFTGDADEFVPVAEPDQAAAELGFMSGITIGGNGATQANGEIATITFAIDAPFNGIFVNSWDDGAYNGMQLRSVTLPGDLDFDNDVDGHDFLVWQRGLGRSTPPHELGGHPAVLRRLAEHADRRRRAGAVDGVPDAWRRRPSQRSSPAPPCMPRRAA